MIRLQRVYSRLFELSSEYAEIDESEGVGGIDWLSPEDIVMSSSVKRSDRDVSEIKGYAALQRR